MIYTLIGGPTEYQLVGRGHAGNGNDMLYATGTRDRCILEYFSRHKWHGMVADLDDQSEGKNMQCSFDHHKPFLMTKQGESKYVIYKEHEKPLGSRVVLNIFHANPKQAAKIAVEELERLVSEHWTKHSIYADHPYYAIKSGSGTAVQVMKRDGIDVHVVATFESLNMDILKGAAIRAIQMCKDMDYPRNLDGSVDWTLQTK